MTLLRVGAWALAAGAILSSLDASGGDVVDEILAKGGMSRADLGSGVATVPSSRVFFALPFLDDLRREPLGIPGFANGFLEAARRNGADAAALFHSVALTPRFPVAGRSSSQSKGRNIPLPLKKLPRALRAPISRLVAALAGADAEVRRAWRGVNPAVAIAAAGRAGLTDAISEAEMPPLAEVEEAAKTIDGLGMAQAGEGLLAAVERAARELRATVSGVDPKVLGSLRWDVETSLGRIRVAGTGNDRHVVSRGERPFLLLVDLGGDDVYIGPHAAGRWPDQPVSVVLDLSGNDLYEAGPGEPSQGSGLGGIGILWDAGGNDRYRAAERSQGFAQFGVGVLVDESGRDDYRLGSAGQGAAIFGGAMLLDRAGDDRYEILHDGQGYGGPGGCGALVDLEGNDVYEAVRDPARAGRPDPRAGGLAATSNAQGAGVGRRVDQVERSWAGGLGVLVDLRGNDEYRGGTFCQGAGYWFGTGVLAEGGGDDLYEAVWYAQGSAAHFAVGALLDVAGDDRYALVGTGGAGMGFGWDFAVGVLCDLAGNDRYAANRMALGAAMKRSTGLFLDAAGDDTYFCTEVSQCLGFTDDDPAWATRDPKQPRWHEASQAGLFFDLGGTDCYPEGRGANDSTWGSFEAGHRLAAPRNLGGGLDGRDALPAEIRLLVK